MLLGESAESAQRFLETNANWTEAASWRAMARIVEARAGVIVVRAVIETVTGTR